MKTKLPFIITGGVVLACGAGLVYRSYYFQTKISNINKTKLENKFYTIDLNPNFTTKTLYPIKHQIDLSQENITEESLLIAKEQIHVHPYIYSINWGDNVSTSSELVIEIENLKESNYKNYQYYPSDFVHALLSLHSYQNSIENEKVTFKEDVNSKYNDYLLDWYVHRVFKPNNADDYYSALYVNEKNGHAVLAHRGTDIIGSLPLIGTNNQSLKADIIEI